MTGVAELSRRALVTGAARRNGLGRGIALRLAEDGADVAIGYRGEREAALEVVAEIEALGRRGFAIQADLLLPAECRRLVTEAAASLGGLDVLVNNAGANHFTPFLELTEAEWERDLAINLSAVFHCSQEAARAMAAGGGGSIAVISSSAAALMDRGIAHYGAAKAGAEALVRGMAYELAEHEINVNSIAPGPSGPTDLSQAFVGDPADRAATERNIPLGRLASVADVAAAVAHAVSPAARYMTGALIAVDGGYTVGKDQTR